MMGNEYEGYTTREEVLILAGKRVPLVKGVNDLATLIDYIKFFYWYNYMFCIPHKGKAN